MTPRPVITARALVAAAAVTLAACATSAVVPGPPRAGPTGRLPAVPRGAVLPATVTRGRLVPRTGAYLGAYVQPASYTAQGKIAAVLGFERRLGRPLGLVHVYHPWTSPFPDVADRYFAHHAKILLLTWGGAPDTRAVVAGRYDAMIRARARALRRLRRPVLLEWRHEMDRPNLRPAMHSPADYIAAWKHIRAIFAAAGAADVSWVWCPTAAGFALGRAQAFYPGNDEVDWICTDAYASTPAQPLSAVLTPFLAWASHHPRPVLVGEFGVHGDPAGWGPWLAAIAPLAAHDTQIKALAYYDSNGSSNRFSFSLTGKPAALSAFAALLAEPYFEGRAAPGTRR